MMEVKGSRRRPVRLQAFLILQWFSTIQISMCSLNSDPKGSIKLLENRSRRRLEPIIHKYIRPGSEVISDCWGAYDRLSRDGYIHYQVNHKRYFVHPGTGAHTQHIERAWRSFKEDIYRYRGNLTEKALKMNLRFIEWIHWLGKEPREGILGRLFKDIRAYYKV